MLMELETELLDLVRGSPVAAGLRIKSLPDTDVKDLVNRWGADAPAVYVSPLAGAVIGSIVEPRFMLTLVVKNARGQESARYGDRKNPGLYPLNDQLMALIHNAPPGLANWKVNRYEFLNEQILRDNGLFCALIEVGAETDMPLPDEVSGLPDFTEFHADFDLDPHASDARHQEWAKENYAGPELPDLQSQTVFSSPKESS